MAEHKLEHNNDHFFKLPELTYLATEATLLDFATDTGSNHTGTLDFAATEKYINMDKRKVENQ